MKRTVSLRAQMLRLLLISVAAVPATAHAACDNYYFAPDDPDNLRALKRPHPEFSTMLQKANAGDASASRSIAASYEVGYLVSQCTERAAQWYGRAARAGDDIARRWVADREAVARLTAGPECAGRYCRDTVEGQLHAATVYSGPNGHYFAPITINGITATGLIDTGASSIAVSRELAHKWGIDKLPSEEGTAQTANGSIATTNVTVPTVSISGITLNNVRVSIGIAGPPLIGMSFLGRLRLQMGGGTLTMSR
ncbi:MAG TPA: retropepsin-like aspartic protease [Noviherbaspirillum sp.]